MGEGGIVTVGRIQKKEKDMKNQYTNKKYSLRSLFVL